MKRGAADQIWRTIAKTPGVKPEEIKYLQLDKFLEGKGKGKVTKQEIQDFMANNPGSIEERVLPDEGDTITWEEGPSQFGKNTLGSSRALDRVLLKVKSLNNRVKASGLQNPIRYFADPDFGYRIIQGLHPPYHVFAFDPDGGSSPLLPSLEEAQTWAELDAVKRRYIRDDETHENLTLGDGKLNDNYRVLLMKLPTRTDDEARRINYLQRYEELNNIAARRNLTDSESDEWIKLERAEFSNEDFVSGHFPDKNVFAHLRVNDKTDPEGGELLFVEEFQSDWHQAARDLRKELIEREARRVFDFDPAILKARDAEGGGLFFLWQKHKDRFIKQAKKLFGSVPENYGYRDPEVLALLEKQKEPLQEYLREIYVEWDKTPPYSKLGLQKSARSLEFFPRSRKEDVDRAESELYQIQRRIDYQNASNIPNAPFKKTWHELAFRRALRLAAEEGKDGLAWTSGDIQVDRNSLKGKKAEGTREFYDKIMRNYADKFGKKFGVKTETILLPKSEYALAYPLDWDDVERNSLFAPVWKLKITPKMRRHLLEEGIRKFTHGGLVDKPLYEPARMIG
jgi:hypothetical protein